MLQGVVCAVQPFKKNGVKQNIEECRKEAASVTAVKAVSHGGI